MRFYFAKAINGNSTALGALIEETKHVDKQVKQAQTVPSSPPPGYPITD